MASSTENERHRRERGAILELLVESGGMVAITSLWRMMDARMFTLTMDALKFHLERYLAPQEYVSLTRARDLPGWEDNHRVSPNEIIGATIRPKGIQVLNRSIKDPEVVIA